MDWKDILKNVITQSRVKEIEDIDIDIDDDDCLRWLNKLYNIILRHPEAQKGYYEINDEKSACQVKEICEDKSIHDSPHHVFDDGNDRRGRFYKINDTSMVVFTVYHINSKDQPRLSGKDAIYTITLRTETHTPENSWVRNHVYFESTDGKKTFKVVKELCNYLDFDYDELLERMYGAE